MNRKRGRGLSWFILHPSSFILEKEGARSRVLGEADPRHSVRCLWLHPSRPDQVRNIPLGGSPPSTSPRAPVFAAAPGLSDCVSLGSPLCPVPYFSLVWIVTFLMTTGLSGRRRGGPLPPSFPSIIAPCEYIVRTTSSPCTTFPKIVMFPSSHGALLRLM